MTTTEKQSTVQSARATNPWGSSVDKLKDWDPKGAELPLRVGSNPWNGDILTRKEVAATALTS